MATNDMRLWRAMILKRHSTKKEKVVLLVAFGEHLNISIMIIISPMTRYGRRVTLHPSTWPGHWTSQDLTPVIVHSLLAYSGQVDLSRSNYSRFPHLRLTLVTDTWLLIPYNGSGGHHSLEVDISQEATPYTKAICHCTGCIWIHSTLFWSFIPQ